MDPIELINKVPQVAAGHQQLTDHASRQLLTGLAGSAKTLAFAGAYQKFDRQVIVVTPNLYYTNQVAEDLRNIIDDVYVFPVDEVLSAEMAFVCFTRSSSGASDSIECCRYRERNLRHADRCIAEILAC